MQLQGSLFVMQMCNFEVRLFTTIGQLHSLERVCNDTVNSNGVLKCTTADVMSHI